VQLLLRWIHVLAGIVWIGHLYFFNFVNVPFQGTMDKDAKRKVNPALLPRALWWFRWGAMVTLLAGLVLFWKLYMRDGLLWQGPAEAGERSATARPLPRCRLSGSARSSRLARTPSSRGRCSSG
jgi:uncharacterized membrane protein